MEIKYSQAADISRKALAAAMLSHRDKIIALLKKYGIAINSSYKDRAVILAVLMAMKDPKVGVPFTNELKVIIGNAKINFTAENNGFFNLDTDATAATTTNTSGKSTLGQVVSNPTLWTTLIGSGTTILSDSLKSKNDKELAQIAKEIEQEKTKQAELLAAGKSGGSSPESTGMSTGAKVAIGIGITVFAFIVVYAVFFRKKSTPKPSNP